MKSIVNEVTGQRGATGDMTLKDLREIEREGERGGNRDLWGGEREGKSQTIQRERERDRGSVRETEIHLRERHRDTFEEERERAREKDTFE